MSIVLGSGRRLSGLGAPAAIEHLTRQRSAGLCMTPIVSLQCDTNLIWEMLHIIHLILISQPRIYTVLRKPYE